MKERFLSSVKKPQYTPLNGRSALLALSTAPIRLLTRRLVTTPNAVPPSFVSYTKRREIL